MIPKPRHLPDALAASEAGSALLARYRASQRAAAVIESECRSILPEFRPDRSGGCDLHGTTLRVNARDPAQVAKLRQAAPRLLRLLNQQGLDVIEIKISVQPRALSSSERRGPTETAHGASAGPGSSREPTRRIEPALDFAKKLALTLPDSSLRRAAQRLAASLGGGLARMRDSGQALDQQNAEEHDP
jgi:hypothetical protein